MRRVLLVGNPNVGKSVLFSRLTGANVIASNYPGTTVEYTRGILNLGSEQIEVIDTPGTYSLEPTSKAEEVTARMLKDGDIIINVVDATNLERNFYLTLELLKSGKPIIVALNMFDETSHSGIHIDVTKLGELLGVPVVPTCAISGEGINELVNRLRVAAPSTFPHEDSDRWSIIGSIVQQVQRINHRHHTFLQALADWSLRPSTGLPIAILVAFLSFEAIRFIGEGLIKHVFDPLFQICWAPLVIRLSDALGPGSLAHHLLIGMLIDGRIDFQQSMGLLTTGLYVPIAVVFPYVFSFYLALGLLEDLGYLPRLSVLMDAVMHRLGLHGLAIIPMMLGLGCNVPGALSVRIFETKRQRFVAATLMAICIPCMAQTAVVIALLGRYGTAGLAPVFGTLALLWIILALILKRLAPGEAPEIFLEIPPYRLPYPRAVAKKLWLRMRQLFTEAVPFVLLGVLIVNLLTSAHVIERLGFLLTPIITNLLGLPKEAVASLLIGFLRKDVAVGMLAPLRLSLKQLIVACVVLTTYFPCAATFVVLLREFGWRGMLKATMLMVAISLTVGTILNFSLGPIMHLWGR